MRTGLSLNDSTSVWTKVYNSLCCFGANSSSLERSRLVAASMSSILSCPSWEVVSMKDVDTRRGLESQLASGNPIGTVSKPLGSGSSTGLSDAA